MIRKAKYLLHWMIWILLRRLTQRDPAPNSTEVTFLTIKNDRHRQQTKVETLLILRNHLLRAKRHGLIRKEGVKWGMEVTMCRWVPLACLRKRLIKQEISLTKVKGWILYFLEAKIYKSTSPKSGGHLSQLLESHHLPTQGAIGVQSTLLLITVEMISW